MDPMVLVLSAAFLCVAVTSGAIVSSVLDRRAPGRRRLVHAVAGPTVELPAPVAGAMLTDKPSPVIQRIASFVPKSPKEIGRLQRRLMRAGYHGLGPAIVFSLSELLLPPLMIALALVGFGVADGWYVALLGGALGFLMPSAILSRLIEKRRKSISNGLPDALDLLIVCLEAGCSLDQAIVKTTEELALAYPPLTEEFRMLTTETRAGKPRMEAFKNLEARTKNEDIRALVAMLVQTDRFGTSVSQALRTFAEVSRTKRRQAAEERAAKVGVKLVFPLVLCLFPALFIATAGAAVIKIVEVFGQN
jgi:tight adherence protein C